MNIQHIDCFVLTVPLVTPFKTALRTVEQVQDLVVKIRCDEFTGYGEAAPTLAITGESLASMHFVIEQVLKPRLLGKSMLDFNQLLEVVQNAVVGNSSAKAAVEIALYDLKAQLAGLPLYQYLGSGPTTLSTNLTISVNPTATMISDAQKAVALGYQQLKLKVGTDVQLDIERVIAVSRALPATIALRLDVNQGWTAKQSIYALSKIEQAGVELELVEQPVKAQDLAGLKAVTAAVHTPVMADESAFSPQQVIQLLEQQAVDIINIKLMKTGGISKAILIAQIAKLYQVPCMMGCMLESAVSVAAAAHLASALSSNVTKFDLDGPTLCQFNPCQGGTAFNHSVIVLNDSPGLGIEQLDHLFGAEHLR
jgi:L-Ala-D/L-Glu epimerase